MTRDPDCIFCKIVAGEIPSFKLYEDADTFAFMDINPVNDGHALVIPKEHAESLYATSGSALAATVLTAKRVAVAVDRALAPSGLNLVQANGPGAAQSVMHVHVHVVPRRFDDATLLNWRLEPGDMDAIAATAERIRVAMD